MDRIRLLSFMGVEKPVGVGKYELFFLGVQGMAGELFFPSAEGTAGDLPFLSVEEPARAGEDDFSFLPATE